MYIKNIFVTFSFYRNMKLLPSAEIIFLDREIFELAISWIHILITRWKSNSINSWISMAITYFPIYIYRMSRKNLVDTQRCFYLFLKFPCIGFYYWKSRRVDSEFSDYELIENASPFADSRIPLRISRHPMGFSICVHIPTTIVYVRVRGARVENEV